MPSIIDNKEVKKGTTMGHALNVVNVGKATGAKKEPGDSINAK